MLQQKEVWVTHQCREGQRFEKVIKEGFPDEGTLELSFEGQIDISQKMMYGGGGG